MPLKQCDFVFEIYNNKPWPLDFYTFDKNIVNFYVYCKKGAML